MTKLSKLIFAFLSGLPLAGSAFSAEIEINAGFNDAWYEPATDGQGFFITVFSDHGTVFLSWFTYDTELPAMDAAANLGDPGLRWLTAYGPIEGNHALLDIDFTSGGKFDTPTEISHTDPSGSDGTLLLTFLDCGSGTVEYDIPSINKQGVVPIQRIVNDNKVICETLAGNDSYNIAGSWEFSFVIDPANQVNGTACAEDPVGSEEFDTITYDPVDGYSISTPFFSGPIFVSKQNCKGYQFHARSVQPSSLSGVTNSSTNLLTFKRFAQCRVIQNNSLDGDGTRDAERGDFITHQS